MQKPAGINVHPGDHKSTEASLIERVHDMLGTGYDSMTFRPSLVHRIDRDTSGCVLIALQKPVLESLLALLQSHQIEKVYHAIVLGNMPKPRDTIDLKLFRQNDAKDRAKVCVDPVRGQRAVTHYRTLSSYIRGEVPLSLLECRIETGRTHQIRVHLSHLGCPIVGDAAYGSRKENALFRHKFAIDRQMLHAKRLVFRHPVTEKLLTIEAPYPDDFNFLLPDRYA